jgi:hypothetical protein
MKSASSVCIYTADPMSAIAWFVILGSIGGIAFFTWRAVSAWQERKRSEEDRFAAFMGNVRPEKPAEVVQTVSTPAPPNTLTTEKLLFDAAAKAGEAGEPGLAIQLYGRLLGRFPASGLAEQARAAIEKQTSKVGKAQNSG